MTYIVVHIPETMPLSYEKGSKTQFQHTRMTQKDAIDAACEFEFMHRKNCKKERVLAVINEGYLNYLKDNVLS